MKPPWLDWARDNMSPALFAELEQDWRRHQQRWDDDEIAKLRGRMAPAPGEQLYYLVFDQANGIASWRITPLALDLDCVDGLLAYIKTLEQAHPQGVILKSWKKLKATP